MKRVLILYDTVEDNTKKVAMALSRGLEAGDLHVDCVSIQEFNLPEIQNFEVVGIGGPTYFHGTSKAMNLFLREMRSLNIENKQGFAFETKADSGLAGSAAKKILSSLRKLNFKLLHPIITGIVLDKEGSLQDKTLDKIEQIGLQISEKINLNGRDNNIRHREKELENPKIKMILNCIKWILIGGGPIFFFIRAIYLASTGGDCFGTINPTYSWILLELEIFISGFTGVSGIVLLIVLKTYDNHIIIQRKFSLKKILLCTGIACYAVHFTRVAIWITLCII
ncbi:MAG: flavodoxin family protein [Candidatus Heimdallarchaeota archaeon]